MPTKLSKDERVFIIFYFGKSGNISDVQREFTKEFRKDPPMWKTIQQLVKKFKETGSVMDTKKPGK